MSFVTVKQKGLSKLQKTIVAIGRRQNVVKYCDALTEYCRFTGVLEANGNIAYSVKHDELQRIKTSRVSICKSFNRLAQQGLVRRVHDDGVYNAVELIAGQR